MRTTENMSDEMNNHTDAPLTGDQLVIRYATNGTVPTPAEEDAAIALRLSEMGIASLDEASALLVEHCREVLRREIGLLPALVDDQPLPQHPVGDAIEVNARGEARIIPRRRACEPRRPLVWVRSRHRSPSRRRKTAKSSNGGSSDSSDGDGGGDPPDEPDLETFSAPDEDIGQLALRLALTISWSDARGELDLGCDENLVEVVEAVLPITLHLLRHSGLRADAAPRLFAPGWALVVREVLA
jgi:hypothetical protein